MGESFDLELAAAPLRADGSDVHILVKVLVDQLSDALGPRLKVERAGGRFRKSEEIKSLTITMEDDQFDAVVDGTHPPLHHRPLVGGHPHPQREGRHGHLAQPPAAVLQGRGRHSQAVRLALENMVIGGSHMSDSRRQRPRTCPRGRAGAWPNSSTACSPRTCRSTSSS